MECIRPEKRAVYYVLLLNIFPFLIVEAGLAVGAYFVCFIPGVAIFLCALIAVIMAVFLYLLIISPILICKTYKIDVESDYIEIFYHALGEFKSVTPLHGKTLLKQVKYPFIKNFYKVIIENGGHRFVIKYLNENDVGKIREAVHERDKAEQI